MRSVKVALRKTLGRSSSLTNEQLLTVLTKIEGIFDSRPITYVGTETEEPIPLTLAHFIIGKIITSLPPVRLHLDSNLSSRKCLIKAFNYREKLMRSFWSRWKNECVYLLNLRSSHSSTFENAVKLSNRAPLRQILKNRQFGAFLRVVFRSCNPTTTRNAEARNSR
ncbi:integrase catalytic domain-containing protein [Trichonephila clavipes]|nr:integrase catalytic domain-containing protein [Trichonephila clavipes]